MKQEIIQTYKTKLDFFETQKAVKLVKDTFEKEISERLRLHRVSAPRFLIPGRGLQDDLAGTQVPVSFDTKFASVQIVHSLAKWKRMTLGKGFEHGTGLYTDMEAIRKDEDVDDIHSIYVDQWDWEMVMTKEQRSLEFLRGVVEEIYLAILETETVVEEAYPMIEKTLPKKITFVHSEELEERWPDKTSKEREHAIAEEHGAVFIIGIGYPLKSGYPHDVRAADYDDWVTETEDGKRGLDGDLIVWDNVRRKSIELSSMGIRVDPESMVAQLEMMGLSERKELEFHSGVISGEFPLSIGGGIGQSRLCMVLLQKAHIGEVHSSVWPKEHVEKIEEMGVRLL
ncbi:aspartate--ammonia ligase [Candidatus Woesearchaeota archaeon]|nr:aspartate--ammonia ligase [Candidatus Woesearchaeota archaeon]